jgi:carboxyl-terminal processing protease
MSILNSGLISGRRLLPVLLSLTAIAASACGGSDTTPVAQDSGPVVLPDGSIPTATPAPTAPRPDAVPEDLTIIWESYRLLTDEYVDDTAIDPEAISEAAVRAMLDQLGDRYTAYISPATFAIERQNLSGNFEGIGAQVEMAPDRSTVIITSPLENSPAEKAGIRPGDKILAVDGEDARGWSVIDAVNRIRGQRGTTVVLTVEHVGTAIPVDIPIVRETIDQPSVRVRMLNPEDGPYGVVKINLFTAETAGEVRTGVQSLLDQGAPGIVLDLRGNPGGLLTATVNVASEFLTDGLVTFGIDASGRRDDWPVRDGGKFPNVPLVVLVNGFSASGSEVLAGALQDHGRALIFGTSTFGKGSVNLLRQLSNGGGLYLTIARWYTPDGRLIENEGVQPDRVVEFPANSQLTLTDDVQMSAAITQLNFQTGRSAAAAVK